MPHTHLPNMQIRAILGSVNGWEHNQSFGHNQDIDIGTEDVWQGGGVRTLPSSAGVVAVTGGADDTSTGTGARTVEVQGLDANFREITDTVTMTGATPVNTTKAFLRVNLMCVATVGSGEVNADDISASIGGDVQAFIEAGEGQTLQLMYTVPDQRVLLIDNLTIVGGRTGANDIAVRIQTKEDGGAWRTRFLTDVYEGQVTAKIMLKIGPRSEVRASATSTGTNMNISGYYIGYLLKENSVDI